MKGQRVKKEYRITFFTGHKVPEADGGEGDDDKVDGLQRAPALDVLEDDSRQGHEDEAAEQDEEQRGEHADLRLADFPLLRGDETTSEAMNYFCVQKAIVLMRATGLRGNRG